MRFYTFLLLIQIATVLSHQKDKGSQKCKVAAKHEKNYRRVTCSPAEATFTDDSSSYEKLVKAEFKRGYNVSILAELKGAACAANRNVHVKDGCDFKKFYADATGDRKLWLPPLVTQIKTMLREYAKEIDGTVSFGLNCDGIGSDVICVVKFDPNGREKKSLRPRKDSSSKTQRKGDASQGPASPAKEKLPPSGASVEKEMQIRPKTPSISLSQERQNSAGHPEEGQPLDSSLSVSHGEGQTHEHQPARPLEDRDGERSGGSYEKTVAEPSSLSGSRIEDPGEPSPRTGDEEASGPGPADHIEGSGPSNPELAPE